MNGTAEPRSLRRYGLDENGRIFMLMDDQPDSAGHFANLQDHREALAEVDRLSRWLRKIEGGDTPCKDESQLRQWAYEALTLGWQP